MPSFAPFRERMRADGLPDVVIDTFERNYRTLAEGGSGLIPEDDIEPVGELPSLGGLPDAWEDLSGQAVVIKLNGGLGTGMGLERVKSLLPVKDGLTFLDVIARQSDVPTIFMDSFATRDDTLAVLDRYPWRWPDLPRDFLQHRVPKVLADDLSPAVWPSQPDLEWCPPGHGDLYDALLTSGTLDALLGAGRRYAFVSNADNLGAVLDPRLLGWFAAHGCPFLMEVTRRTEADRKGGHLARRGSDGRLVLREAAQCPDADAAAFQDVDRHRWFNTNNLMLDLQALRVVLREGVLGLPLIRNRKTLDPRDAQSPPVYQLETAMGAAVEVFAGAVALAVPRTRFAPVKTTDDLLAVRSDAYVLTEDARIVLDPSRAKPPLIALDPRFYKKIDDLDARFPQGAPSLLRCDSLRVRGDFVFGRHVVVRGDVVLEGGGAIEDGALLEG